MVSEDKNFTIIIAGAGGIGRAVGLILAEYADFGVRLMIGDRDKRVAEEAAAWITEGNLKGIRATGFHLSEEMSEDAVAAVFSGADILLDCLPGAMAPRMGQLAKQFGLHYVNLTEYVKETEQLIDIGRDAGTGFILQTGLAPGFVNVLACRLYRQFVRDFGNEQVDYVGMKVGALTRHAQPPHFYGLTWSPIGVATEYFKHAVVIDAFQKTTVPSLSDTRKIVIDGIQYEEDFTSGGAADLPDAFAGLARKLDYKTLRYPGHYQWVRETIAGIPDRQDPIAYLEKEMLAGVPFVETDKVIIYATVNGKDKSGLLRAIEQSFCIGPVMVGRHWLRAIQSTTAAPMAECARILLSGRRKGVILQSQLDPEAFMQGPFVQKLYFGRPSSGEIGGAGQPKKARHFAAKAG